MQNAVSWLYETYGMTDAVEMQSCGKRSDRAIFSPAGSEFISKQKFSGVAHSERREGFNLLYRETDGFLEKL